jgi:hypothetical protein
LRVFCLSTPWQIYETLYLLLRVQECRFVTPSQGAGLIVLCMGDGILTHLSFRFPDPTVPSAVYELFSGLGQTALFGAVSIVTRILIRTVLQKVF